MSSYREHGVHPKTGKVFPADWLDDYFGSHLYGIRFVGEEHVYGADEVRRATSEEVFDAGRQEERERIAE